jgi:hypothetical protein
MGSSSEGNGVLHAPQRPASARCFAAMRFFWPQLLQVLIAGIAHSSHLIHLAGFGCIASFTRVNRQDVLRVRLK